MLKFRGSNSFRQRLVLSTVSGKAIRIDDIRAKSQTPGLKDFEACLLRLIEKLTNGCVVEINETGTSLLYRPGIIAGGSNLQHDCGKARSIGYFLEPVLLISLFGKQALSITLRGVTGGGPDPSIDTWRSVTLPLLRKLTGGADGFNLKVLRRGAFPEAGGQVFLECPIVRSLPNCSMTQEGMVRRVRGVAHSMRVSPQISNRMVDGARGPLNTLLADVFIFTDHMSGPQAGHSPGFGITLVAETTSGGLLGAEAHAHDVQPEAGADSRVPEEVGLQASQRLLQQISCGGVVDQAHQALILWVCALGPKELNECRLGPLTPYAVQMLRHLRDFVGTEFRIKTEQNSSTLFLSCVGVGIINMFKSVA